MYAKRRVAEAAKRLSSATYSRRVSMLMWQTSGGTRPELYRQLERLRGTFAKPVLVPWGEADAVEEASAPEIRRLFPDAEVRTLKQCGHFPWVECEGPYLEVLDQWLATLHR